MLLVSASIQLLTRDAYVLQAQFRAEPSMTSRKTQALGLVMIKTCQL